MFTTQSGNVAGHDLVGRDKISNETHIHGRTSPLASLYERLRSASDSQPYTSKISDQLQHYCNAATDGDVRGLEDKLVAAQRTDLVAMASRLKEAAAKNVMKWQTSGVAQDILTYILGKLYTDFMLHVTPAIQAGASRAEIDALISDKVLHPVEEMLGDNDLMLTPPDLLGLLFFLGGNCHIRWDAC